MATQRPNGLLSDYAYNPAGHLRRVRHRAGSSLRGQFNYTVDGRGNRTRAYERVAQSTTVTNTLTKTDTAVTFTRGTWTDDGAYKKTTQFSGRMQIAYTGDEALLTVGVGPDHGIIDISINGRYWRRFDAYATTPAERVIHLPEVTTPQGKTTGKLSIKVRSDRHRRSTGFVFRFKQLAIIDTTYTDTTIDYTYDALSRLTQADYDDGTTIYDYAYDLAGNLTNNNGTGQPPVVRTFNAANQMTNDGTNTLTYDPNGNLTSDGTNTYTWDRANRLAKVDNGTPADLTAYAYDGLNNRISQSIGTTNPTVTQYLLDTQPGLTKVLAATTGANTERYIHASRGLHAQYDGTDWQYITQDGLGSVRSLIDATLGVDTTHNYDPYGNYIGTAPTTTYFGFTGEQTDPNDMLFLRARYYNPALATFSSLDPFEGTAQRPMSLNGYSWVEGNPIMHTDPSGRDYCSEIGQSNELCDCSPYVSVDCSQYYGTDAASYTECLACNNLNPCPSGHVSVQPSSAHGMNPYCVNVDSNVGQLASILWEQSWQNQRLFVPLSESQLSVVVKEANRFGLPPEFLASVLAAEIVFDTDFINTIYDASTDVVGTLTIAGYHTPFLGGLIGDACSLVLSGFHEYLGAAPYLEGLGFGYGSAPGIGNIHAGVARRTEDYFNAQYAGQGYLPNYSGGWNQQNAQRLMTLRSDEGNIRYVAAELRRLTDLRTGQMIGHTNLSPDDMRAVFIGYHCALGACFGGDDYNDDSNFRAGGEPIWGLEFANQLDIYLEYYQQVFLD